jgi:hypothetical protein
LTEVLYGFEYFLLQHTEARRLPWLQQVPDAARQKSVGIEDVFLELQFRITAIAVARRSSRSLGDEGSDPARGPAIESDPPE